MNTAGGKRKKIGWMIGLRRCSKNVSTTRLSSIDVSRTARFDLPPFLMCNQQVVNTCCFTGAPVLAMGFKGEVHCCCWCFSCGGCRWADTQHLNPSWVPELCWTCREGCISFNLSEHLPCRDCLPDCCKRLRANPISLMILDCSFHKAFACTINFF